MLIPSVNVANCISILLTAHEVQAAELKAVRARVW
jgi:hypothetical protein